MSKKYVCTEGFSVQRFDEDGFIIENEYDEIETGSVWEVSDNSIVGGEIHLEKVGKPYYWLEITKERFEACFEQQEVME
jgi:hypothetical protein